MASIKSVRPQRAARGAPGVQLGEATARSLILQAGARVFAEQGVRAASVADILTLANVSRRTFYRFYQSKEDVMVELYRVGTEGLLTACRVAVQEETDPGRKLERVIDAHLRNAQGIGRLVFVLGGEAQRFESPLHARRTEVRDELARLLGAAYAERRPDPWLMSSLLLALEGLARTVLTEGDEGRDVSPAAIVRAKRVMMRLAAVALVAEGPDIPALPKAPKAI